MKAYQRHTGLTLFSGEQRHEGLAHAPRSVSLQGGNRHLYTKLGARIHNRIGGSQDATTKLYTKTSFEFTSQRSTKNMM
jgi:hypothetical protein